MIDISNLTSEKRAFLKVHPDLLDSLETGITQQAVKVQTRKQKENKGKSKLQRDLENIDRKVKGVKERADELRRKYDPHLMRIQRDFVSQHMVGGGTKGLVCPVCGRTDEECGRNRMNGRAWCFKCNSPLVPKDKVGKWKKRAKVIPKQKWLKDEFKRMGLEF